MCTTGPFVTTTRHDGFVSALSSIRKQAPHHTPQFTANTPPTSSPMFRRNNEEAYRPKEKGPLLSMWSRRARDLDLSSKQIGVEQAIEIAKELIRNKRWNGLNLSVNFLGDQGAVVLADALQANRSLLALNLFDNSMGDVGMTAIAESLQHNSSLATLLFGVDTFGIAGLGALAAALKVNTGLQWLGLVGCSIDDDGATILAEALHDNTALTTLNLADNRIGDRGGMAILSALNLYNTRLRELVVEGNHFISWDVLTALSKVLRANIAGLRPFAPWQNNTPGVSDLSLPTPSLEDGFILGQGKLSLVAKNIDAEQAKQLSRELASDTHLKFLNLNGNIIGDQGVVEIANALCSNASLETLYLASNRIGDVGMTALAQALTQNTSLVSLMVALNVIGTGGLAAFADVLTVNSVLTLLWLDNCLIDDQGTAILADSLKTNATLATLSLANNCIGDEGAKALLVVLSDYNTTLKSLSMDGNAAISSTLRSQIEDIISLNRAGTRPDIKRAATPLHPSISISTPSTHKTLKVDQKSAESEPTPIINVLPRAKAASPASTTSSGMSSEFQLDSSNVFGGSNEWLIGLPTQRAELEFELSRLTAVLNMSLETLDEDQWQKGIDAERQIQQIQSAIASGNYPTSEELQVMVDMVTSDIRQKMQADSLAAAVHLRERLARLREDLSMELEAEFRVQQIIDERTEKELIEEGRRSVLAALHSTDPQDEIGAVPIEYLASITGKWSDELGSGGFGTVFKGQDVSSGVVVAIKRIPADRLDEQERSRFKNEIEVRTKTVSKLIFGLPCLLIVLIRY
jgi:Ran GTPase-activating protein (RanGAP) involved in mRNA processing and transport